MSSDNINNNLNNDAEKSSLCCGKVDISGVLSETKELLRITGPVICTQIFQMLLGPVSLIFCGHLGDTRQLDGTALAVSMINVTCLSVAVGMGTVCDTYFSQSFGSQNKSNVGVYVQKCVLIFSLALFPCLAIHINLEEILVATGQDPEISRLAAEYVIIFIPGSVSIFAYVILSKYLMNQNIVIPSIIICAICNGINTLLHYVFLYQFNWGIKASSVAQAMSYTIMFVLTLLYIICSKNYKDTWPGWSVECLYDWGSFVKLCAAGTLMVCMEWWFYEMVVCLGGLLGETELGTQSVIFLLCSFVSQIPLGIQLSSAIRIGQHLGLSNAVAAKKVAWIAATSMVLFTSVIAVLLLFCRRQLPFLFTNIESVAELSSEIIPILAVYGFFDYIGVACKGVLYGTGRQVYGAALLFISYYILALPMTVAFMFYTNLGIKGCWLSIAANHLLQCVVLVIFVLIVTDWEMQAEKAVQRTTSAVEIVCDHQDDQTYISDTSEKHALIPQLEHASSTVTKGQFVQTNATQKLLTWQLVLKRTLVAAVMVLLLLVAVLVKVLGNTPSAESIKANLNSTLNSTELNIRYVDLKNTSRT